MTKWKHRNIAIVQAFQGAHYNGWFGLGSDGKLYQWDRAVGAWEKFWNVTDGPE